MSLFKKIMMWVGIIVSILILIAVIMVSIAFYATSGLITTIENQLTALRSDDIVKAYSYTSKDFQSATSLDDFKKFINRYPSLKNNEKASFTDREVKDHQGKVRGTLQSKDGAITPIEYRFIKEDGVWKILSIQVNPTGAGIKIDNQTDGSTSSHNTTSNEIALPNLYEDKNNKFSINYPADWEYEAKKGTVILGGKRGTPSYFSTVNIQTVLTKKTGGTYSNVKEFMDDLKKQAFAGSTDVKILAEGPIQVEESSIRKKMDGRYMVFSYTYKGERFQQLQFVFLRHDGDVFYAWGYTAPIDRYEPDYPIAKAMFATWSVY